jgi:hypothetical protein
VEFHKSGNTISGNTWNSDQSFNIPIVRSLVKTGEAGDIFGDFNRSIENSDGSTENQSFSYNKGEYLGGGSWELLGGHFTVEREKLDGSTFIATDWEILPGIRPYGSSLVYFSYKDRRLNDNIVRTHNGQFIAVNRSTGCGITSPGPYYDFLSN